MTPQTIWNEKILGWEKSRYSGWSIVNPLAWAVRARLHIAAKTIFECAPADWRILELGCGSGWLAERLACRYESYLGIDFADCAVQKAKRSAFAAQKHGFHFLCGDILNTDFEPADLTVFLGVTDWITDADLAKVFAKIKSNRILFSFTDAQAVSRLSPYRLYRRQMDHFSYRAKSYRQQEILAHLRQNRFAGEIVMGSSIHNPGTLMWAVRP